MTIRLYYDDPELREFDASVVRVRTEGDRQSVWLDRTAFYPTTGGQPFDTGLLGSAHVVDVVEDTGTSEPPDDAERPPAVHWNGRDHEAELSVN